MEVAVIGLGSDLGAAKRLVDGGFKHLIFSLPPTATDRILAALDVYANLAGKLA
jgi:hypothetical protein